MYQQALVKWVSEADLSWEPIDSIKETEAVDRFEKQHSSIEVNDGPPGEITEKFSAWQRQL